MALAVALADVGGDWLAPYRVPDSRTGTDRVFQAFTRTFLAVFDPRPIGLQRVAAELTHGPAGWQLSASRPWYVLRPTTTTDAPTFAAAVALAAEYVPTPF